MKISSNQRKRLYLVLAAAVAALTVVVLSVCLIAVHAKKCSIKGEWKSKENITYVFKKNNALTGRFDNAIIPVLETEYSGELEGEYTVNKKAKTLSITLNYYNKKITQNYSYEIKNSNLVLKNLDDGTTAVFYKQKTK